MDLRKIFLEYFKKNDHLILPSSSLIPSGDPSVLLTTAGMQQFKPYYLGIKKPPSKKIATVQKCFRTTDIDKVGYTNHHLTFFEMLGNFAFADYFKKEAINFAMDFLLNILKLSIDKLSVGVFAGDDKIPADSESAEYWKLWGIPENRIYKYGKSENFWGPAGDTGPCGPCSEIYYDFGREFGCSDVNCSPSCECGRFLEIWNLVFTQYNFNGKYYEELPNKNIDTGMGLERIAAVLNGDPSVFKTNLFIDIITKIEELSNKKLSSGNDKYSNENFNRCIKIIADHSRAIAFLIADGVYPSNEARGYILRRIIRRAVRFARLIDIKGSFLNIILDIIIKNYSLQYPELKNRRELILKISAEEERKFSETLSQGLKVLSNKIEELKLKNKKYLSAEDSFKLYDTFGFPVELTMEILKENGLFLDLEKFTEYLKNHSEKSKSKTAFDKTLDLNVELYKSISKKIDVLFTGYEDLKTNSEVKFIIKKISDGKIELVDRLATGEYGEIILEKTPFYGEKGGQVGDKGVLKSENTIFNVEDTKIPVEGLIVHRGRVKKGNIKIADKLSAEVDEQNRKNVSKNHTSTHILHWALRTVFGKDIYQAGSYVGSDLFRFDYSIGITPDKEDIERVERIINEKIQNNDIVRCFETTKEYADEIGAISLFEEKYGKFVRLVEINEYSRELCGGTHVNRTGEIGLLKIISDSSIGANIRRIEAVTGLYALNYLNSSHNIVKKLSALLDSEPRTIIEKVEILKSKTNKLQEDITNLLIKALKKEIMLQNKITGFENKANIIEFDFSKADYNLRIDAKIMGLIGDEILNTSKIKNIFIIFNNILDNKPIIILQSSKDLIEKGIDCGIIAKKSAKILGGGGGGKPSFATVGGFNIKAMKEAIEFIKSEVLEVVKQNNK